MKEATGELSTTVIAIVAIAAILAVFTVFLLPTLRAQIALTQACTIGPGYNTEKTAGEGTEKEAYIVCGTGEKEWTCTYYDKGDKQAGSKTCKK